VQIPCKQCGNLTTQREGEKHRLWKACNHVRQYGPPSIAVASSSCAPSPPPPLFDRDEHSHSHLSLEQRVAITVLHKEGRDESYIAQRIPCDVRSVRHWLAHPSLQDQPRRGRKRKTTAEEEAAIVAEAEETKFTTPRRIRRKLGLDVSSRTIDHRLIEVGLFGRVARIRRSSARRRSASGCPSLKGIRVGPLPSG
jgi:transposase